MILFVDASNPEVNLALIDKLKIRTLKFASQRLSEGLLSSVEKFLRKNKLKIADLKKIAVVTGPGPFSRMRTAVVTSNALAYALNIPVAGIKVSQIPNNLASLSQIPGTKQILPFYEKHPNITKPKNR